MLYALAICVGFFAGLLQGFSGFGSAIFSMAVLALVLGDIAHADRMVVIMSSTCVFMMAFRLWRDIQWNRLGYIAIGVLLGVPTGVLLGPQIPPVMGRRILGGVIVLTGLYRLWRLRRRSELRDKAPGFSEVGFGIAGGLLSGWVNMSGPPLVYWAHHRFEPTPARACLAGGFIFSSTLKLVSLTAFDMWIPAFALAGLAAVPAVILGTWLGDRFARRARPAVYAPVIWALFILLGVLLIWTPRFRDNVPANTEAPRVTRNAPSPQRLAC